MEIFDRILKVFGIELVDDEKNEVSGLKEEIKAAPESVSELSEEQELQELEESAPSDEEDSKEEM